MKIPTDQIPQADSLDAIEQTVRAVAKGVRTHQEIALSLGYSERQGRYYRQAAEILGFIRKAGTNYSKITLLGDSYIAATQATKPSILATVLTGSHLFQRVIAFIEWKSLRGATRDDLQTFIRTLAEKTTRDMIERRTSTVISWLKSANLVSEKNGCYVLNALPNQITAIDYDSVKEPLIPTTFDLAEYKAVARRTSSARAYIVHEISRTKLERANAVHVDLTNRVAERIRQVGSIPKRNFLIDLAAQVEQQRFIFEIKTTPTRSFRTQIRRGISQLYEYRYLQHMSEARLVLIIEKPLPQSLSWMIDYLIEDRGILLVWGDEERNLYCPNPIRRMLHFLVDV